MISQCFPAFKIDARFQTLLLANNVRKTKTVGEIVNLMAIDVERFQMITLQIQQIWSCPFQVTLFVALCYSLIIFQLG